LPLAHDGRCEGTVAVAGHLDVHRPNLGEHRLGTRALRELPPLRPIGSCLSSPTCSVISTSKAVSSTDWVSRVNKPPWPTNATPSARACSTSSCANCC
jgi:hypothetical protein